MADEVAHVEHLWGIDHCRGSLDCFTAYRTEPVTPQDHWDGHLIEYPITRRTPKRVYYEERGRERFVNRQELEEDGEASTGRRWWQSHLYAVKPPMPDRWALRERDLKALKVEMAELHPDRGGDPAAFREAHRRYERARVAAGA